MHKKTYKNSKRENIFERIFKGELSKFSILFVACLIIFFVLTYYF